MGELRKDYILDRFVVIATERAKRPHQFLGEPESKHVEKCFFCPGNENETPPELGRIELDVKGIKGWSVRYFPNKYPAVQYDGVAQVRTDNVFYTFSDAFGVHEVIVETPEHDKELQDLSIDHLKQVLDIFKQRTQTLKNMPGIKYVSVFKNSGREAGTSLVHTHSQVIGYNIIPKSIREMEEACDHFDHCPYCDVIASEMKSTRRCLENTHFVSFAPYASRFPIEVWLFPKRHVLSIEELTDDELFDLARMLKTLLTRLKVLHAPYNLFLNYGLKKGHFHVVIAPRLSKWGGFEHATDTVINSVIPADAASFYRNEKKDV